MSDASISVCLICKIARGDEQALIVESTDRVVSFLPLRMQAEGHIVVAPTRHFRDLFEIPSDELSAVLAEVRRVAFLCRSRLGATGVNLLHASGSDAQQSVDHFHIHVIPRRPHDGLQAWPPLGPPVEDREGAWRQLTG
jgi:histidine triad (HIT) family protein